MGIHAFFVILSSCQFFGEVEIDLLRDGRLFADLLRLLDPRDRIGLLDEIKILCREISLGGRLGE